VKYWIAALLLGLASTVSAQMSVPAGLTVGPMNRTSPLLNAVRQKENFEPVLLHPEQVTAAKEKISALERKTGKKPNVLLFLVDDLGYGDVGAYGGGESLGAPTPHIDRLAREGLKLTSTYSQRAARRPALHSTPVVYRCARGFCVLHC